MSDAPRTDGKIAKCLDLCEAEACGEYVRLCLTLERELAAVTQERDALRKELAEARRQVAAIIGAIAPHICPHNSPCVFNGEDRCIKCWSAWAAQQAKEGGK